MVSIDNIWERVDFDFNGEKLVFRRIPNNQGREGIAFGLFSQNDTQLGESFCRVDRFDGKAWYLDNIEIFTQFQRSGYGTQLLERTCKALWQRELADIILERPGNSIASDGFNRKLWYEKHGFEPHPHPELTWMWHPAPTALD